MALNKKTVWVILMTGGGHFAGAVFQGSVFMLFLYNNLLWLKCLKSGSDSFALCKQLANALYLCCV